MLVTFLSSRSPDVWWRIHCLSLFLDCKWTHIVSHTYVRSYGTTRRHKHWHSQAVISFKTIIIPGSIYTVHWLWVVLYPECEPFFQLFPVHACMHTSSARPHNVYYRLWGQGYLHIHTSILDNMMRRAWIWFFTFPTILAYISASCSLISISLSLFNRIQGVLTIMLMQCCLPLLPSLLSHFSCLPSHLHFMHTCIPIC